jgi:hypothetical protein
MWLDAKARRDLPLPVWERGHRIHGYWLDDGSHGRQRVGHVALSPRGLGPVVYSWRFPASRDRRPDELR